MTWPAEIDIDALPAYSARPFLAQLHSQYYGPISPYTLASWSLPWVILNGRACCETRAFVAEAQRRFDAARCMSNGLDTSSRVYASATTGVHLPAEFEAS